jgi:type IV secretion system protein VirB5
MLMPTLKAFAATACLAVSVAAAPTARAQWAVVDVGAIAQLIQQLQIMERQLTTSRGQLLSSQQVLQAMSGDRGMENLLSGTQRNYLPTNWAQLMVVLLGQPTGTYAGLSGSVQSNVAANAVLSPQQLAALSSSDQQQIQAARQWSAMQQAVSQAALANASGRFAALQTLISAISTAKDQKASLDLQARISAELGMLQNEQTKLQVLSQAMQAQESSLRQQQTERAIAGQGNFSTRFQPTP